ncbi:MFS transporter [Chryseobacterium luquanense]|uniref:Lysosomal dipeptide transporter MFSD1 n=1 Tax=Chryseobacterium luquanense TaxID=2983766 RepID=A0ABT3Y8S4_9FLAO|nr:MFS transporter [Chryseobacterium luquanense]MCX8534564.1 MFS transporter [Chryseobacterium luquanense]
MSDSLKKFYVIAWVFGLFFYFLDYVIRSAPAVMLPQLSDHFDTNNLDLIWMIGTYYYTYSTCSLLAGIALDKFGGKKSLFVGTFILGMGALLFLISSQFAGISGRLLQGAGCAFAFPGCVYLASKGFSSKSLATAIGFTQCIGMLGGASGQFLVGPWVDSGMDIYTFWLWSGIFTVITAFALYFITPKEDSEKGTDANSKKVGYFETYKVVFKNPQSWLCGLISGLLFAPTTIFAMTWAVAFFEKDKQFVFHDAAVTSGMVAFGWVFGCPLLGFITDKLGRRKPVLIGGAVLMILSLLQLIFLPELFPAKISMFILGVGSGAAMIPYSVIKETNPDYVKGSSTGAINFITFGVTTLLSPIFSNIFGENLGNVASGDLHFQNSILFWIGGIVLAILISFMLKETGRKVSNVVN